MFNPFVDRNTALEKGGVASKDLEVLVVRSNFGLLLASTYQNTSKYILVACCCCKGMRRHLHTISVGPGTSEQCGACGVV